MGRKRTSDYTDQDWENLRVRQLEELFAEHTSRLKRHEIFKKVSATNLDVIIVNIIEKQIRLSNSLNNIDRIVGEEE